jgi:phenylacetate-CoA ligase
MTLIQRIKANPLEYARKAIDPRWWARRGLDYYIAKRMSPRRGMEAQECGSVLELLNKMNEGSFRDTAGHRNRKLFQILHYAGEHCPYYKEVFQQAGFNPENLNEFERLPLLDKDIIRNRQKDLISDEIDSTDFYVMNTGGSTGEPLEFFVSRIAAQIDAIHQEFVFRLTMRYQPGDVIVAFDGSSVPGDSIRVHKYWTDASAHDIPYGRLSYSSLYLRAETIPYYVKHIMDTSPSIFRGYPSFISDISEYVLANRISIPFHVKGVQLTAENASEKQVENIRKAFNTSVFFQYGHSEVCVYGYTFDQTYEYLCSPFYGFTEVLDGDGKRVNVGGLGEVVVTGFYNYAMPFVRYRTGDLALYNGEVDGIVRLGKIAGRTQDFILDPNGERVALTALIFGQHYRAFKHIQKWQLQQDIAGRVKIRIIKAEGFSVEDEAEIQAKFKDICGVETEFEYVDRMPLSPRGKFMFLIQHVRD